MSRPADDSLPLHLTTKEVAALLRVKERKVYDLAAGGEIPHRRITGKLLFPRADLMAWLEGGDATRDLDRPSVVTGSHDPLLDWTLRASGAGLATLWNGSLEGLECFSDSRAAMAALHIPEPGEAWNVGTVAAHGVRDCVLIAWAVRARGLLLAPQLGGEVTGLADLVGRRLVRRQPGSGAAALMERLVARAGLRMGDFAETDAVARTESEAAAMVASHEAEAALGLVALAGSFHLDFCPLGDERVDLLVDRRSYFTQPVQHLLAFLRDPAFADKAAAMGGYGLDQTGAVRWVSP